MRSRTKELVQMVGWVALVGAILVAVLLTKVKLPWMEVGYTIFRLIFLAIHLTMAAFASIMLFNFAKTTHELDRHFRQRSEDIAYRKRSYELLVEGEGRKQLFHAVVSFLFIISIYQKDLGMWVMIVPGLLLLIGLNYSDKLHILKQMNESSPNNGDSTPAN